MAALRDLCNSSLVFRVRGTVVTQIWPQIVLITIYTVVVVWIHKWILPLNFQLPFLSVLGVVTGMLLGFRSNTAYDRYYEGRRLWSTVKQHARHLTRCIWIGVNDTQEENVGQKVVDKLTAIRLVIAFAFATKNYLRKDYSRDERNLVQFLPPKLVKTDKKSRVVVTKYDDENAYEVSPPTNIPLEVSVELFEFIKQVSSNKLADGSTVSTMYSSVTNLVDALTGFERIQRTPMPKAYNVHLHQTVWLFLLLLPSQYLDTLGWWTTVTMPLVAFAFLGILALGREIEKPFGLDPNDLPLEQFCQVILEEVEVMVGDGVTLGRIDFSDEKVLEGEIHKKQKNN